MATGTIPASFPSLKGRDSGLSFAKSVDFTKVAYVPNSQRRRSQKVLVIKNLNSGSDTVELHPASEGSPLLGITSLLRSFVKDLRSNLRFDFGEILCFDV